jgi:hypothetical protein
MLTNLWRQSWKILMNDWTRCRSIECRSIKCGTSRRINWSLECLLWPFTRTDKYRKWRTHFDASEPFTCEKRNFISSLCFNEWNRHQILWEQASRKSNKCCGINGRGVRIVRIRIVIIHDSISNRSPISIVSFISPARLILY